MNQTLREKFENFSSLSDDECAFIITNHLIEAIESDVYIDWEIVSKFMTVPYPIREDLCKLLNFAIKKNQQKIGNYSISEWIKRYLDKFAYKERTPNTFFDFVKNSEETQSLPKNDKIKLMRVLRIYDYLLIVPIFDLEGPVSSILRFPMWLDPELQDTQSPISNLQTSEKREPSIPKTIIENISISEALKRYPEIGDQLITLDHIKIKNSNSPVRPSIRNWLSDYVANLGYESHNSMMRGNYLFQNENAKILNYQDRQKLSQILKSFDEKTPLTTNITAKLVNFSSNNFPNKEANAGQVQESHSSKPKIETQFSKRPDASNYPDASIYTLSSQNNYQSKTHEPGINFEKVIRLEEKKSESVLPNIPKIVNLKESEKEKPAVPTPPVKNLVNIKEIFDTSKEKETERSAPSKPFFEAKKDISSPMQKAIKPSDKFYFQEKAERKNIHPLSAANNSISHDSHPISKRTPWINNTIEPLDEAEKKLFESNNENLNKNQAKNGPNSLVSGIPISDFSKEKSETHPNIQFTSHQKLSHEKEQEELQKKPVTAEKPSVPETPKMQPYRIRPASFEDV